MAKKIQLYSKNKKNTKTKHPLGTRFNNFILSKKKNEARYFFFIYLSFSLLDKKDNERKNGGRLAGTRNRQSIDDARLGRRTL